VADGFCENDEEVFAGDRTSWRTAGFLSDWASSGLCHYGSCGVGDVRAWFAATNSYIEDKFKPHLKRYKNNITTAQAVPNTEQQQVITEANALLADWNNYASYYRKGGGGPIGASWGEPGYDWGGTFGRPPDPEGPDPFEFVWENDMWELCKEIVRYYDDAACMRNKFVDTRPEGMLQERPGIGVVPASKSQDKSGDSGFGMNAQTLALGFGGYLLLRALVD